MGKVIIYLLLLFNFMLILHDVSVLFVCSGVCLCKSNKDYSCDGSGHSVLARAVKLIYIRLCAARMGAGLSIYQLTALSPGIGVWGPRGSTQHLVAALSR